MLKLNKHLTATNKDFLSQRKLGGAKKKNKCTQCQYQCLHNNLGDKTIQVKIILKIVHNFSIKSGVSNNMLHVNKISTVHDNVFYSMGGSFFCTNRISHL